MPATMRREYRLGATPDEALAALREHIERARDSTPGESNDVLDLQTDDGSFTLVLGPDRAGQPAALLRGQFHREGNHTRVTASTALAPLRPGVGRATARDLAEWALVIGGLAALGLILGFRTVDQALAIILRWSLLFLAILGVRVTRRALRRRRDQAQLLSLVEGALGPLLALPEGSPFRTPALRSAPPPDAPS